MCCAVLSHVQLFATPWTVAHQAPLSMGILQARILEWVVMPSSRKYMLSRYKFSHKWKINPGRTSKTDKMYASSRQHVN